MSRPYPAPATAALRAAIAGVERLATLLPIIARHRGGALSFADALAAMTAAGSSPEEAKALLADPSLLLAGPQ